MDSITKLLIPLTAISLLTSVLLIALLFSLQAQAQFQKHEEQALITARPTALGYERQE